MTIPLISHSSSFIYTRTVHYRRPWVSVSLSYCLIFYNQTKQNRKIESYIPYTNHPPKPPLPSSTAFSDGQFRGLYPDDRPNPDPTTAASHEGRRVRFLNCIWLGMRYIGEEALVGVGYQFSLGEVTNYAQDLRDVLIHVWHFPLPIEASLPYVWPVFF